jgi:transposase
MSKASPKAGEGANKRTTLNPAQVRALVEKLRRGEALQSDEMSTLATIVENWAYLSERAHRYDLSMADLRRILGVLKKPRTNDGGGNTGAGGDAQGGGSSGPLPGLPGGSSLASNDQQAPQAAPGEASPGPAQTEAGTGAGTGAGAGAGAKPRRDEHGRRGEGAFAGLPVQRHGHTDLGAGCPCPQCQRGRLYAFFPRRFVAITGQAPFAGQQIEIERLQCNLCRAIFEAPLPDDLQADGVGNGRLYSHSANTMVVMLKYLGVMPWSRQETLQAAAGVHVPDASMADMCVTVADLMQPVMRVLYRLAAHAPLLYGDDTTAKILGLHAEIHVQRRTGKNVERTGCHTSGVIAHLTDGHLVALFRIGIQHTGEFLDAVLSHRTQGIPPPLVMSDASNNNGVTVAKVIDCACNAHCVRRFKGLAEDFPAEADYILSRYGAIYKNDARTKEMGLSPRERLAYHKANSATSFREMCEYAHKLLEERSIEPNSKFGEACDYLLNHERALSAFLRYPGAPMDNNLMERHLRLPVRLRDAAPFFKTKAGALMAGRIWSVLVTAMLSNVNVFDYLNCLQRHRKDVRAQPERWLPWCYRERVTELERDRREEHEADGSMGCESHVSTMTC